MGRLDWGGSVSSPWVELFTGRREVKNKPTRARRPLCRLMVGCKILLTRGLPFGLCGSRATDRHARASNRQMPCGGRR